MKSPGSGVVFLLGALCSQPSRSRSASKASRHCRAVSVTRSGVSAHASVFRAGANSANASSALPVAGAGDRLYVPGRHRTGRPRRSGVVQRVDLAGNLDARCASPCGTRACDQEGGGRSRSRRQPIHTTGRTPAAAVTLPSSSRARARSSSSNSSRSEPTVTLAAASSSSKVCKRHAASIPLH